MGTKSRGPSPSKHRPQPPPIGRAIRLSAQDKKVLVISPEVYRALPELERIAADALQQLGKLTIQNGEGQ